MNDPYVCLTYFTSILHFYTPRKRQKIRTFLLFSGVIEMEHWRETG